MNEGSDTYIEAAERARSSLVAACLASAVSRALLKLSLVAARFSLVACTMRPGRDCAATSEHPVRYTCHPVGGESVADRAASSISCHAGNDGEKMNSITAMGVCDVMGRGS